MFRALAAGTSALHRPLKGRRGGVEDEVDAGELLHRLEEDVSPYAEAVAFSLLLKQSAQEAAAKAGTPPCSGAARLWWH